MAPKSRGNLSGDPSLLPASWPQLLVCEMGRQRHETVHMKCLDSPSFAGARAQEPSLDAAETEQRPLLPQFPKLSQALAVGKVPVAVGSASQNARGALNRHDGGREQGSMGVQARLLVGRDGAGKAGCI